MDKKGLVLIVDDDPTNRKLLSRYLVRDDYAFEEADEGQVALNTMRAHAIDVVLLDLLMPGLDGFQVLAQMKADPALQHIPVIIISTLDQMDSILQCIEMGATDYLPKPLNAAMLRARLNASLAQKRLYDIEQAHVQAIQEERERADQLLLNILPAPVAEQLKRAPGVVVQNYAEATVLFADIVDFTQMAAKITPEAVVTLLDEVFSLFDDLAEQHGLEKIKTIGDAYMAASGVPVARPDHAEAAAEMALAIQTTLKTFNSTHATPLQMRIGLHSGPVTAGVIGRRKFIYDLWGDAVNTASRMEAYGVAGAIHVSTDFYQHLKARYKFQPQGLTHVKGKGEMQTYLLLGR